MTPVDASPHCVASRLTPRKGERHLRPGEARSAVSLKGGISRLDCVWMRWFLVRARS